MTRAPVIRSGVTRAYAHVELPLLTEQPGFETKRGTIDSQNNSFSSCTDSSVPSVSSGRFKESRRGRQICDVGVAIWGEGRLEFAL